MNGAHKKKDPQKNRVYIALITATTAAAILASFYYLSSGWFIIFQNLFYIPIILSCIYYETRGFIFSVCLALFYLLLVLAFTSETVIILQALIRVALFIAIAGVTAFLTVRRRLAEEGLKKSRRDYRYIFENAVEGIFQVTPGGRIISVNPAYAKLLGYNSSRELMKRVTDIAGQHYVDPEDHEMCKNILKRDGLVNGFEAKLLKKNGEQVWVSLSARAVMNDEGEMVYQGTAIDITERKHLEEALENDQIRLANDQIRLTAVLDSIDAFVYVSDLDSYEVLFLNKCTREAMGNIVGQKCWKTIQKGQEGPCEFCTNGRLLSDSGTPTGVFRWEHQNTKNGRWYDCRDQAITWTDGRLVRLEIATDITERKKLEEALRESEEKFKTIFNGASDGILLADLAEKRFLQGNAAICSMLGYAQEELEGLTVYDIHPQEDIPRILNEFEKQAKKEKTLAEALPVLRKDGSVFYADVNSGIVTIGGTSYLVGIFRDITERKKLEEALRESEEKFKTIFNGASDGIILTDSVSKRFIQGNAAICSMLGYAQEEIEGLTVYDIHPQEDIPHVLDEFEKLVKKEKTLAESIPVLRKDGSVFYADIGSASTVIGGSIYLIGIFRDITERKEAEEMVLNERNKFLTLSRNAPFGMLLIDEKGSFSYVNPKFEELFGYSMEEVPDGKAWFRKAFPDPEYRKTVISAWVEDLKRAGIGQKRPRTFTVHCKDGTEKIINFIPVQLETGEHMMTCNDITRQKRLEQQLHVISLTDELTGRYNRRGFITLSEQQLKLAERAKRDMLLFFVDLDKMKHINDTLGHHAGDMALIEVAAILKEVFRESDIIGRIGGDEFAVLAIDIADEAGEVIRLRMRNALENHNLTRSGEYQLSLSMGMARYDHEKPLSLDELMTRADAMMYEDKKGKQH